MSASLASALPDRLSADAPGARGRVIAFPGAGCPTVQARRPELDETERDRLNRLRWFALRSRLSPRPDIERACFLLAGEHDVTVERYALCFFQGLSQRAHREMVFYRPGTATVSDDEMWLIRLVEAQRRGRKAFASALVKWRVRPDSQRWLRFLSEGLANAL